MDKNIEVLQEVLDLLEEEKEKFYDLVNQNDFRIEEINSYLKDLSKNEEDDYKVFSPRNAENRHREEIETDISEKKKYEEENIEFWKKIEYLKVLINKVNIVVDNLQSDSGESEELTVENRKIIEEDHLNENLMTENSKTEEYIIEDSKTEDFIKENMIKFDLEKKHLGHQILNCVSFITSDVERAKVELTALARKIIEY